MTTQELAEKTSFLEVPPTRCTAAADRLGWADQRTYRGGPWDLGIRTNTEEASQWVDRILAAVARPELRSPYANLGVVLNEPADEPGSDRLHMLYHKCKPAFRARNPRRVLESLLAWVDSYHHALRTDVVALDGHVLVAARHCVIVSHGLDREVRTARRRLLAHGIRVADTPTLLIDPARAEVVVEPVSFGYDQTLLNSVEREIDESDRPVEPGRYRIEAILTRANQPAGAPVAKARAAYALASTSVNRESLGPQRLLDDLGELSQRVPTLAGGIRSAQLTERAVAVLGGDAGNA